MKAYLANGLFTIGDRLINDSVSVRIRNEIEGLDLYVPQENSEINEKSSNVTSLQIAEADCAELMSADFLIAVIDGVEIDAGVAAEIGIFSTTGKPIYALYTDIRQQGSDNVKKVLTLVEDVTENQFMYRNLFVVGLIKRSQGGIYPTINELVVAVKTGQVQ
jgi:nucleoside 2-deoxyribosyltransferase